MLNIITGIVTILCLGAIGGLFGGMGFAYIMSKKIDKKIKEYENI